MKNIYIEKGPYENMKRRWLLEERMFYSLGKDKQEFLHLIRPAMIGIDNLVDVKGYSADYFNRLIQLIKSNWNMKTFRCQNKYESQFALAIQILRRLYNSGFYQAQQVYEHFLEGYDSEYRFASRRNKVLTSEMLEQLNTNIGAEVVSIFFLFLTNRSPENSENIRDISRTITQEYGFAIKLADNAASLYDDILEGFVTIPVEDITEVSGITLENSEVIHISRRNLSIRKGYVLRLLERIKLAYEKAHRLLDDNRRKLGLTKLEATTFKNWANTWAEDIRIKEA